MHCEPRNNRHRWGGLVIVLALGLVPATSAGAGSSAPGAGAALSVRDAHAEVLRSEQRLAEITVARDAARAELTSLNASSAELVDDIASARAELRRRAVAAFVSSEDDKTVLFLVDGEELSDASTRVKMMTYSAERSSEAVDEFNALRDSVTPEVLRLGTELQQLEQDVLDANDAVLAARAAEAEAERQEQLRELAAEQARAERERAERAASADRAARAAAAAAAAATAPGSTSVAADGTISEGPAAPVATAPLPSVPSGGPSEAQWAALRKCESGGNYRAVSKSGTYRGAYQFDHRTWAGLGGSGDPAAAPPAEQDARAKVLYSQRSWRPWPVCGRFLR